MTNTTRFNLQPWILAARPKTLPASISPVILGWALAAYAGNFRITPAIACLLIAILLQSVANMVNDALDFKNGADAEDRIGPLRVTQAGLLTYTQIWVGIILLSLLAAGLGAYLIILQGLPVLYIGLGCLIAVLLYSGGPFPAARIGLGELFVLFFFGFVAVEGTVFAVAGDVPEYTGWISFSVGCLASAILVVNNVRDISSDRRAGRKNIPVCLGRRAGEWEYVILLSLGLLALPVYWRASATPWVVLLPVLSIPEAARLARTIHTCQSGLDFNRLLARTARFVLIYSVLLSAGLLLARFF